MAINIEYVMIEFLSSSISILGIIRLSVSPVIINNIIDSNSVSMIRKQVFYGLFHSTLSRMNIVHYSFQ